MATRTYQLTMHRALVEPGYGYTVVFDFREEIYTTKVSADSLDELAIRARVEASIWLESIEIHPERPDVAVSVDVADGKRSPNGFAKRFSGPILLKRVTA